MSQETTEDKLRRYLRRTATELDAVTARLREAEQRDGEPVAIVGMGCRFPGGVDSPEALWELVARGADATAEPPTDRGWDPGAARGGFLRDVARFDAEFFGISPREAMAIDPQQRILLEVSWEALERAGQDPRSLRGSRTGVFTGVGAVDYGPAAQEVSPELAGYLGTGTAASVASGRIAYALGLEGAALTVDTACSSSLTALHLAMAALRRGECDLALAGGVSVMSSPGAFHVFGQQGGLAPDGRCKPFAEDADGFALAEGAGMLVLQRVSRAEAEGRPVLAVLRGAAVNSDGASNGLTAPNGPAQTRVIRQALDNAGLRTEDVDYVEAHGTGTVLGDPIEANALLETYGTGRDPECPLWIGSVKANLGHTQAAAGVAGVLKVVQALRYERLPTTPNVRELSSRVDWDSAAVSVLTAPRPWSRGDRVRRAGVSSFGISGTNAHLLVEEAPEASGPAARDDAGAGPLVLSAMGEDALRAQARRLAAHLDDHPHVATADAGYTLATRRSVFERRAVVVGDRERAIEGLRALAEGELPRDAVRGTARGNRSVVLVFPGQGPQWPGMARELLASSTVFAEEIAACERALRPHVDWSLTEVLTGGDPLDRVDVVQPALFAVMVSLAALWRAHGVEPTAVVGHSQGEIAAACVAGALSREDAAQVVAVRSRALRELAGTGAMASVALSSEEVRARIEPFGGALSVASINGPRAVVVAGRPEALDDWVRECEAADVRVQRIPVDYASHSRQVEALRSDLLAALAAVTPGEPHLPLYSTTTGARVEGPELNAEHWYANLRRTVRFDEVTRLLIDAGRDAFVEVSPHPVLTASIESTLEDKGASGCAVATLRRDAGDLDQFRLALGEAYTRGVAVDWRPVFPGASAVELPTYPFQGHAYWLSARTAGGAENWRYRVRWRPMTPRRRSLAGRLLILTGPETPPEWAAECRRAVARDGGAADEVRCRDTSRTAVTEALREAGAADAGAVLSLLDLREREPNERPAIPGLVAALDAADVAAPLWVVTRDAVVVLDDDPAPSPGQAAVSGLARVLGLERPALWGGLLDVPAPDPDLVGSALAALADPAGEDHVAVRASGAYVPRMVPAPRRSGPDRWTPPGTALITGGTGGIGAHVARWLAREGTARLVLLSRRGPEAPGAAELERELSGLGARVTVAACDVADRDRLEDVLSRLRADGVSIDTVLHTAGIARSAPVAEISATEFAETVAAKVDGAVHLDALCPEADLVLFSSNAGVWGGPRLGAYAAANAFLDAFAARRRRLGRPTTSIAWGLWAGDTMAGRRGAEHLREQGLRAMAPERALAELRAALAEDAICLSVLDWDPETFVDLFTVARRRPLFDELLARPATEVPAATGPVGELAESPLPRRREQLGELVRAEVAAVLGHLDARDVDPDRAFRELGLDSVMAVELRNRLADRTGLRVATTVVFDHPTVAELAEHLALSGAAGSPPAREFPEHAPEDPIAVVGMACRFPGGIGSPDELWRFLDAGGDAISELPTDRGWNLDRLYDPDGAAGTTYCRHGGFLPGAAEFDAAFFGISPREALAMDPQQRQVLETSWELFENAGIDPHSLRGGDTGVFLGAAFQGYGTGTELPDDSAGYALTGSSSAVVSGRVAYVLGLRGPALTVDTACSSSLVALHTAAKSLRDGECGLAVAGGVSVMAGPEVFTEFSRQGALAPDGRCKPFSAEADGFGFAEGVALVLLERLSDARRRGHQVLAVVAGSAINQDGASNGLSAPSGRAQEEVIRGAWARAGITGSQVDLVEGHGTGTRLGDPIELGALAATYGVDRPADRPLWIGSVKSNIGHTQAAAGVAGVIKVVAGLRHGTMPGSLLRGERTPLAEWNGIEVAERARTWEPGAADGVRRAGISAFGVSGTNAHVVLAEPELAPPAEDPVSDGPVAHAKAVPIPVSARTPAALVAAARRLESAVDDEIPLRRLGRGLATSRAHLRHRAVLLPRGHAKLRKALRTFDVAEPAQGVVVGEASRTRRAVFVFPGQGPQWEGMARSLLDSMPEFRRWLAEIDRELAPLLGFTAEDVLRGREDAPPLERVDVVQPVLFAVNVCLARLWRHCGIEPVAVIGHSQGEIAAACVAGVLSVADAVRVVALRARALRELAGDGGMLSIATTVEHVQELITTDTVSVAAYNSPGLVVVAGESGALAELEQRCVDEDLRVRTIPVDYASHSPQVERIREQVLADLAGVTPGPGEIPVFSTLYGRRDDSVPMDAQYWYDNLRSTVRFNDAVVDALEAGYDTFVETSPRPVLTGAIEEIAEQRDAEVLALGTLHRLRPDDHLAGEFARAHVHGLPVDWSVVLPPAEPVALPNYPFEHERFWLAPEISDEVARWRYRVEWRPASGEVGAARVPGSFLVVATGEERRAVIEALSVAGARTEVLAVDPVEVGRRELAELLRSSGGVDAVLSLLALDPETRTPAAANLVLHQALGDAGVRAPLWLVTTGGVPVADDDSVDPDQAMVWGLGRVLGLEAPQRWGGLVDLCASDPSGLVAALTRSGDEDQLALRDGTCHVRRLVRAPLGTRARDVTVAGTALITGGTGALGAHVARQLARGGTDRLVLVSRSGPEAPGAAELESELAELGASVTIAACDVADRAALAALLDEVGRIDTVVHLAGVPSALPVDETSPDDLAAVVRAKAMGARWLDELCPDAGTFVLFSSGAGVWGSGGLGAYAAGNAFVDALAQRRRARGGHALSIAWGAWSGAGMAGADRDGLVRRGLRPMAPDSAVRALQQALEQDDTCVSVADVDWERFAVGFTARRARPLIAELVPPDEPEPGEGETSFARQLAGLGTEEIEDRLRFAVRGHVATVLGHANPEAIGWDEPFSGLGFDSLTAVAVRNALRRSTGVPLPTTLVFDHPTVRAVAAHLASALARSAEPADGGGLRACYRQSVRQGRIRPYVNVLADLAEFRERFDDETGHTVELVELAEAPGRPRLLCCAGTAAVSGPHEYARLAGQLRGRLAVAAVPQPGYRPGEPLPASLAAVLGAQARAVLAAHDGGPIVLAGHSAGAMMAYALATELADRGHPPDGVVLVDVYPPDRQEAVHAWLAELTTTMFEREQVEMDDTRLTAMGAYDRFMRDWSPRDIGVPTLLVRASEPMGRWSGERTWKSTWDFPHHAVDVAGDHFSMISEHAAEIADCVRGWIDSDGEVL